MGIRDTSWTVTVRIGWCPWLMVYVAIEEFGGQELGGKVNALPARKDRDMGPPHHRDPNLSPLLHALIGERLPGQDCKALPDRINSPEIVQQVGMARHDAMLGTIFPGVNSECGEKKSQDGLLAVLQSFPMPKKARNVEIGRRLQATRLALKPDLSLRDYIKLVENPPESQIEARRNLISKYEAGSARVDDDWISRQRIMFGITADWILFGEMRGMAPELHEKLHRLLQRDDLAAIG